MKFLVPLLFLLTIIAFSNCETPAEIVKNFEAKIISILAAKNFDDFEKYVDMAIELTTNETNRRTIGIRREDLIGGLKNGTFTLFKGIGPNDVPKIKNYDHIIETYRNFTNGRKLRYRIDKTTSNDLGYIITIYYDVNV
ncbi:unnamed protein product [Caenorhabditis angaria]|uniref:DUF38 domain-containing protein n=1 Tax=Caenorhabditis angaria TaxID=860376 RepID=A0A9P1MXN6_9PELO|nr:unnamed protein product [Caenorhabditis angaria]